MKSLGERILSLGTIWQREESGKISRRPNHSATDIVLADGFSGLVISGLVVWGTLEPSSIALWQLLDLSRLVFCQQGAFQV